MRCGGVKALLVGGKRPHRFAVIHGHLAQAGHHQGVRRLPLIVEVEQRGHCSSPDVANSQLAKFQAGHTPSNMREKIAGPFPTEKQTHAAHEIPGSCRLVVVADRSAGCIAGFDLARPPAGVRKQCNHPLFYAAPTLTASEACRCRLQTYGRLRAGRTPW